MPITKTLPVKGLQLDLKNFRTVPQRDEASAVHAMISINPDWFWALMESLLDDGYHPTENIIVQKSGSQLIVKEGNRRIAALKIMHGYLKSKNLVLPANIASRIKAIGTPWKQTNSMVPCAIYEPSEADLVDRVVSLTHGKGEKAGRDRWNPIAKARHNRDTAGGSESALDLLEKYLKHGTNLTLQQKERWSGDYPLTVLEEAIKRVAPRLGCATSRTLADKYPKLSAFQDGLEDMIRDIGLKTLDFQTIRGPVDFAANRYGIEPIPAAGAKSAAGTKASSTGGSAKGTAAAGSAATSSASAGKKTAAVALNDPRAVARALRRFSPKGNGREKLVTLLEEIRRLSLDKHPHAFCFLLRSMFEISAKAYCDDNAHKGGLSVVKANGEERALVDVLRDVVTHITNNNTDKQLKKRLHGAMANLASATGILSVTSMNQLVHNPRFSIDAPHICTLFGNILPLLEEMNR